MEIAMIRLSIIIPAYNEEKYLPATLDSVERSIEGLRDLAEVIVVDNESRDSTAEIARASGAKIVEESVHNISRVRNTGARAAAGDMLMFLDADTCIPVGLGPRLIELAGDPKCFGGAVVVDYTRFERSWMRVYSSMWRFWGEVFNMKGGAAQFCRRDVFESVGGYDESVFVGEDIEFYWAVTKYARQNGGRMESITDMSVTTSSRRFDKMGLVKTLVVTHPVFIGLYRKKASAWKDWYENAVR
jgi:glycosyltransferase involved in cell wall biosynthesis